MKTQHTPELSAEMKKLISVFKVSKPYELEYSYRTKLGKQSLERDRPVLKQMISLGLVEFVCKTSMKIRYKYIGEKEVTL